MGAWKPFHLSASEHDNTARAVKIIYDKNPNPRVFEVVRKKIIGSFVVAEVKYPNCTNYEGRKILLYRTITWRRCMTDKMLDPHFSGNNDLDPLARFEPTPLGWSMAIILAGEMSK